MAREWRVGEMTVPPPKRQHWIVDAVRRMKVARADELGIAPDASLEEAWKTAADGVGMALPDLAEIVAKNFACKAADLEAVDTYAIRLVPEATARKFQVLPLRASDRQITVATANPIDMAAEQALGFASGRNVSFEVAAPNAIATGINIQYSPNLVVEAILGKLDSDEGDSIRLLDDSNQELVHTNEADARPMVRLTSLMLQHAINERASDVHVEPGLSGGHVRIRVDGVMQPALQLPMSLLVRVVSRIKILAKLDIADRHRPQDGRARIE